MNRLPVVVALLALVGYTGHASAATYCVADAAQLRSAINSVSGLISANGNEIRVQSGTHNVAVGASGNYALSLTLATAPLTITGGWNAGCTQRNLIADATIISGNNAVRLLEVTALAGSAAELRIDGVSFRNGLTASGASPSCLRLETDVNAVAVIEIDRSSFRNCRASGSAIGAAVDVVARDSFIHFRSNVFTDNTGGVGTIRIANMDSTFYFNGNTVAYNDASSAAGGPAGIQVSQPVLGGVTWMISNIVWGNGNANSSDLYVNINSAVFTSGNVFGVMMGDLGDVTQTGNLSGNPGFNSPTDLRLRADSIARNSGALSAAGGYATHDVFGDPRIQGGRVDRGAHEFGELFANSFE